MRGFSDMGMIAPWCSPLLYAIIPVTKLLLVLLSMEEREQYFDSLIQQNKNTP